MRAVDHLRSAHRVAIVFGVGMAIVVLALGRNLIMDGAGLSARLVPSCLAFPLASAQPAAPTHPCRPGGAARVG